MLNPKGKRKFSIEEATEILRGYGLSSSKHVTYRLIREGKLQGIPLGTSFNDRRSGFVVSEDEIFNLVSREIPSINDYVKEIVRLKKALKVSEKASAVKAGEGEGQA